MSSTTSSTNARSDYQHFLGTLTAQDRRYLTARTNWHAGLRLSSVVALQLFCVVVIVNRFYFWPAAVVALGILLVCLFHLMHECTHATAFRSRRLNHSVAGICGLLLLLPPRWFRYFHFAHHRYTQDPLRDPELAIAKPKTRIQWAYHVSGLGIWLASYKLLFNGMFNRIKDEFVPEASRSAVCREIRIMLTVYALVFVISLVSGSFLVFWLWIIPGIIGQPFLRLYLLAEHADCDTGNNMFGNTRTVLTNPFIRWFTWNMPFHTAHHVYPAVPFYRLPEMNSRIEKAIVHSSDGYVEFNQRFIDRLGRS